MSQSTSASSQNEAEVKAGSTRSHQPIFNSEVLTIVLKSIRSHKEGTQSLAYLRVSGYFSACWRSGESGAEEGEEMNNKVERTGVPDTEGTEVEEEAIYAHI